MKWRTITISEKSYRFLCEVAAELQKQRERKPTINDALTYLLNEYEKEY